MKKTDKTPRNVLLLGSGGREHAFAVLISKSALCGQLYIAPGNAGTELEGTNVDLKVTDFPAIKEFIQEKDISVIISGPEDPLVAGIVDYFESDPETAHVLVVGPSKAAAALEGSKSFAKEFMVENKILTAQYCKFTVENFSKGEEYICAHRLPIVLKADGLAAGKGVVICDNHQDALLEYTAMLKGGKFGNAGGTVVVEEYLEGIEFSVFIFTNGWDYFTFPTAKDYKRAYDGDKGANTGGMGSVSPAPFVTQKIIAQVHAKIIYPTLKGMQEKATPYRGFLYFGLMLVGEKVYVIEYNCRMGDPETESVFMKLEGDILQLMISIKEDRLQKKQLIIEEGFAITVALTTKEYPASSENGKLISFYEEIENRDNFCVFCAGTKMVDNLPVTNGGRVMYVCAKDDDLSVAQGIVYEVCELVTFEGMRFRTDIGVDILKYITENATMTKEVTQE